VRGTTRKLLPVVRFVEERLPLRVRAAVACLQGKSVAYRIRFVAGSCGGFLPTDTVFLSECVFEGLPPKEQA